MFILTGAKYWNKLAPRLSDEKSKPVATVESFVKKFILAFLMALDLEFPRVGDIKQRQRIKQLIQD